MKTKNILILIIALATVFYSVGCKDKKTNLISSGDSATNTPKDDNHKTEGDTDPHEGAEDMPLKDVSPLYNLWLISTPYDQQPNGDQPLFQADFQHAQGETLVTGKLKSMSEGTGWYDNSELKVEEGSTFEDKNAKIRFFGSYPDAGVYVLSFKIEGEPPYSGTITSAEGEDEPINVSIRVIETTPPSDETPGENGDYPEGTKVLPDGT